ncbi:MAG: glycosyltransferase family A protein [Alphaproteobacteria bacterium]
MSQTPKVSVVIPNYNREVYVREAIDSILAQSFTDYELLVIDDGSSDGSCEAVLAYDDERIRLIRNGRNLGIAATRNAAVARARGVYLAFLDSDDIARADRLAKQVAFLDQHPEHGAVGSWLAWMDSDGRAQHKIKRLATDADTIAAERLFRPGIVNSTAMARTACLRAFPHAEHMVVGSDYEMWARFAASHKIANLPECLVRCRRHGGRVTEQRADLVKQTRCGIYRTQLDALGVAFSDDDLEAHFLLRRMHRVGFTPDDAYVAWAGTWLAALRDANRANRLYPEPAFSQILGVFWAKTCRQAGWARSWRPFLGSRLSLAAAPGLLKLARREGRHG